MTFSSNSRAIALLLLLTVFAAYADAQPNFPPFASFFGREPTIDGDVSYYTLINQIQQWHRANPNVCGQDTSSCGVQQLINNFESCAEGAAVSTNPQKDPRIINGCPVNTPPTVGWSVAVLLNGTLCGGTLVSPQHVVLAAHCLSLGFGSNTHPSFRRLGVIAGASDLHFREPGARMYSVESFARHPHFGADVFANDTAILRLAQPVPFNGPDGMRPACLADRPTSVVHQNCLLSGYGITSFLRNDTGAGNLRYSVLGVQNLKKCLELVEHSPDGPPPGSLTGQTSLFGNSAPWLFCATGKRMKHTSDSCRGDSGSGVMCKSPEGRWTLQGVVSFGPNQCAQVPSFYADAYNLGIKNPVKSNAVSTPTTVADRCSATKVKPASSTFTPIRQPRLPPNKLRSPFGQRVKIQLPEKESKTIDLLAGVDDTTMRPVKNSSSTSIDLLGTVLEGKVLNIN